MRIYEGRIDKLRIGQTLVSAEVYLYILSFLKDNYNLDVSVFKVVEKIKNKKLKTIKSHIMVSYIIELVEEAIEKVGSCEVVFKLSKFILVKDFGLVGYIMQHAPSLNDALLSLCHYYPLLGPKLKPILSVENGYIKLTIISNKTMHLEKYRAEVNFATILDILNQISETPIVPIKTIFQHSKPLRYDHTYEDVFGKKIFFDEIENALYFDKEQLNAPTKSHNPYFFKLFTTEADIILEYRDYKTFKKKVCGYIFLNMGELDVSLESIAVKMEMHPRTIQENLKKEGSSFTLCLNEIRQKLAIHYLLKGFDTATIATYLGYVEVSPFLTAFKKWYGVNPKTWLEQENGMIQKK
jgi:AraC-like DNA-binding protein